MTSTPPESIKPNRSLRFTAEITLGQLLIALPIIIGVWQAGVAWRDLQAMVATEVAAREHAEEKETTARDNADKLISSQMENDHKSIRDTHKATSESIERRLDAIEEQLRALNLYFHPTPNRK